VGEGVGCAVGLFVEVACGFSVGGSVVTGEEIGLGFRGFLVGSVVGKGVGCAVGLLVGVACGFSVGGSV